MFSPVDDSLNRVRQMLEAMTAEYIVEFIVLW